MKFIAPVFGRESQCVSSVQMAVLLPTHIQAVVSGDSLSLSWGKALIFKRLKPIGRRETTKLILF